MAGQIRIDTDQVNAVAQTIENLNGQLKEELNNAKSTIKGLSTSWEGEAANAVISSFDEFSDKYFQSYYDVIDNYVKFLRNTVVQGYETTESTNTSLADQFK